MNTGQCSKKQRDKGTEWKQRDDVSERKSNVWTSGSLEGRLIKKLSISGLASWAGGPCSHTGLCAQKGPCLVVCSAVTILTFLIFEQGIPHFRFVLSPTNYVASPYRHFERQRIVTGRAGRLGSMLQVQITGGAKVLLRVTKWRLSHFPGALKCHQKPSYNLVQVMNNLNWEENLLA